MPNYRLTHKITGTTVPATAGYYGLDSQSSTVWKRAGGGAYAWQSPTFANTFFMGATVDLSAYNTVTISGCVDAAFNGAYVYSTTALKWLKSTTHSLWKDGTTWKLTDGTILYTAADNGLNIPPSTFSKTLDYPLTITVSGAGTSSVDGSYAYDGEVNAKPSWAKTSYQMLNNTVGWTIFEPSSGNDVYLNADAQLPAKTGWITDAFTAGDALAPTLEYSLISSCSLSVTSSAKFASTSLGGTWSAINGGTGTPAYYEYTMSEAWDTAEKAVFDSLAAFLGNTEDIDCFRGYIPQKEDGKPKSSNVWKLTSGGSANEFSIDRTYGLAGNWCNELINAEVEGLFENRSTAMQFAGSIQTWLKENHNMNETGNVNWCHLRNLPEAPAETIIQRQRHWSIKIPLEILFLTEAVYS